MPKSKTKPIQINQFAVTGTNRVIDANKTLNKLLISKNCHLTEARYRIDGKTIVIKPLR